MGDAESGQVRRCGLMHSYHIVAELRHFRGAPAGEICIHRQVPKDVRAEAQFGAGAEPKL
jgi:hypothetical protein